MKSTLEHLKAARAVLAEPINWHQGDFAAHRAEDGTITPTDSEHLQGRAPNCWCILGALRKTDKYDNGEADQALRAAMFELFGTRKIVAFNDQPGRTHKDVLAVFDRAIAHEQQWQQGQQQ
ncbi:hypothetical protein [Achromobacter phage Motura]|uniref:Uncharacterized protein n=1 Tax=Achromobacter phage Motura TaxID=2591403 RepID=A0A514CSP1_9CAUD|nr:hypothetical protein H1O15_gp308 [Achromobacter phage Motura]QDH83498.1 hypothetical protein [Achromobacter phage Motura]